MIGPLSFVALLAVGDPCTAQTAADAVGDPPGALSGVHLGQPLEDVQKLIPDAKFMGSPADPTALLLVLSGDLAPWDSAGLEFFENRLVAITLLLGSPRKTTIERVNTKLAEVLARHGEGYAKQIALDPQKRPSRMFIWQTRDAQVFATGPVLNVVPGGGPFVVVNAVLRVGITTRDLPMNRVAQLASMGDLIELLFRALQFQ